MIFRPFYYYDLGCASYLLGCGTLGAERAGLPLGATSLAFRVTFASGDPL